MTKVTLTLDPCAVLFYTRIALRTGLSPEKVMADALLKLAGELSLEAIKAADGLDADPPWDFQK